MKFLRAILIPMTIVLTIPQYTTCKINYEALVNVIINEGIRTISACIVLAVASWVSIKAMQKTIPVKVWNSYKAGTIKDTFDSIAGNDNAKEELQDIVCYLREPQKYKDIGANVPKGVLMYGPPGTGKTSIARSLAGEAQCSFISVSGSAILGIYQAQGSMRIEALFKEARSHAPCIIFIDEIDAIARNRSNVGSFGGGLDYIQTLNQLLAEMDGFERNTKPIIVVATTNNIQSLDPAIIRPGRFDRLVVVELPDRVAREKILKLHARKVPFDPSVDFTPIVSRTTGFSGADLQNLINEAAIIALKMNKKQVDQIDLEQAFDKIVLGKTTKSQPVTQEEKRIAAYHEAGHTLINILLADLSPTFHKVTIVPRGQAGGFTAFLPKEAMYRSKNQILAEITMDFGGRAAEELIFNAILTGAVGDIEAATNMARAMVCTYGMSEKLGPVMYRDVPAQDTMRLIDEEIQSILDTCHNRAYNLLCEHKEKLDIIAQALIEKETLSAQEVYALLGMQNSSTEAA